MSCDIVGGRGELVEGGTVGLFNCESCFCYFYKLVDDCK